MNLLPYLNFDGNCMKAIKFYEKVFSAKAAVCLCKDIVQFDPKAQVPKGKENFVMHANMNLADGCMIQFADCDEQGKNIGTNICLQLSYKTAEEVKATYNALKAGGKIICKLQPTFFAPLYTELVDKFNIRWSVMQEPQA